MLMKAKLCYTQTMQEDRSFWPAWAQFLQRRGMDTLAATLLETAGPLNILLAQFLFATQPFFSRTLPDGHWQALATLLNDSNASQSFAAFLREEVDR